jgi:peptide/nickel transport system ATP-binding protein
VLSTDPLEKRHWLALKGEIPKPTDLPQGCFFYSRCTFRHDERCATERPPLHEVSPGHFVRSFYELGDADRAKSDYKF